MGQITQVPLKVIDFPTTVLLIPRTTLPSLSRELLRSPAAAILALSDEEIARTLDDFRQNQNDTIADLTGD